MAGIPIPNFSSLASEQGQINQQSANQTTLANRPNQTNPYGSLTWSMGPDGQWTQRQTLSGTGQSAFDSATNGQANLSSMLGLGVSTNGLSDWGDAGSLTDGVSAMPDGGFGASQQVIDAVKGLQQPGITQARDAERARLAAMGITLGSDASNTSERNLGNAQSDADMKAILAGTQEYGNVFNRGLAQRQQGVSENEKSFNMAQALRGAQSQERLGYNSANQGNLAALNGVKSSLTPGFASFNPASSLAPQNQYQAGLDMYNAALAQQNADSAAGAGRTAGYAQLAGQGLGALGGVARGASGLWDWINGGSGGGDAINNAAAGAGDAFDFLGSAGDWGTGSDWGNVDYGSFF